MGLRVPMPTPMPMRKVGTMITGKRSPYRMVGEERLKELRAREDKTFLERTAGSRAAFEEAHQMLLNGIPMPWMGDWGTEHPVFVAQAKGVKVIDIDGNEYVDFCLGDTGAMFGHSPAPTITAVTDQVQKGITTMMPSLDAIEIGRMLSARFGLPIWQVAMTATEANRYVIRNCRALT
ncbi:MAG: hypothetical protein LBD12_00495, partial [Clostridiales Family XIII bacterium]|nr:hypothetical protein [Clostridiales Family XIII bacterium]